MDEVFVSKSVAKPNFVLDWLKGFKSDIGYWEPFVHDVSQRCNANVEVMGFANPETRIDFLSRYRQATYERFFWNSPNQQQNRLTHIAGAHSLGALLLLEHLIDDEKAKIFRQNYDGLYIANPFLGDKYHDRMLCRAFSNMPGIREKPTGSTLLERFFGPALEGFQKNPTHRQSDMLHMEAQKLLATIREKGVISEHLIGMPIAIIAGENDPACNNQKIYDFADYIGLKAYTYLGTAHNPLLCSQDALEHFEHWAMQVADSKRPKPPAEAPAEPA